MYNRNVQLFGEDDAAKLALYDLTGDGSVENMAKAYSRAATPEAAQMIKEAAQKKEATVAKALSGYADNIRLSGKETEQVKKLQAELLPTTKVDADSYNQITSDPVIKNFLKQNMGHTLPEYKAVETAQTKVRGLQDKIKKLQLATREAKADTPEKVELVSFQKQLASAQQKLRSAKGNVDRALPESTLLFRSEVGGHAPQTAFYLDAVRKRLQDKRYDSGTSASDRRHYAAAVDKLDNALSKATGGSFDKTKEKFVGGAYDEMKSLQQRRLLTNELDKQFAGLSNNIREGYTVTDVQEMKKIFAGRNFSELAEDAAKIKEPKVRAKAEQSLSLIRNFVRNVDPETVVKQLGASTQAEPQLGGVFSTAGREVGTFMRGEYNKEVSYLIDHPQEYVKQLEKIAAMPNKDRFPAFARLLANMSTGESDLERVEQ
jgi:hypothetical protein